VLNGIVFGAFHLSFEAPVRFLPTAWLGIVIAWVVLVSGSLWTGVLMHLLNNASIVLLASAPSLSGLVTDPDAPPPLWLMAFAAVALGAGAWALGGGPGGGGSALERATGEPT
jgi:membrane protease YdiL (CAAX protease family)